MNIEKRAYTGSVELRMTEGQEWPEEVAGVAAVVNQRTDLYGFEEEIAPGAFDEALTGDVDIRALFNHDSNQILGRTKSGTAKVWVDEGGNLAYTFTPDKENPVHVSVVRSIQRGDITQSSFAFTVQGSEWLDSDKYGYMNVRRITKIKRLYDVSPVTYPAYQGTTVGSRDMDAIKAERDALIADRNTSTEERQSIIHEAIKSIANTI